MKKFGLFVLAILFCSGLTAQSSGMPGQNDWWYTFERGKVMFRQGKFGDALLTFEDARRQRRTMYERMERDFIDLLSLPEVRRMGDSLDWVERFIQEKYYTAAGAALNELYYRVPKESLHNSATAALAALSTLKDYPEAEYWIGETYLKEGELSLALSQYQKALVYRSLLETPGLATEVLYKIAGIRRLRQEYNEMQRILESILKPDVLWSGIDGAAASQSESFARQAMTRTLESNGINRFLTMYRYNHTESAEAHRLLGFYFYISGRHARAQEHLMFAFLIQNSVIIEEVRRRQFDYTFTTVEALASQINRNPLLSEYAEKNEYYKTAYYLGASLYANGKGSPAAQSLWSFLANQPQAGEWQARSVSQLRSPYVERGAEMP
jgi:tetratricopeptide (TPR) repeat protein